MEPPSSTGEQPVGPAPGPASAPAASTPLQSLPPPPLPQPRPTPAAHSNGISTHPDQTSKPLPPPLMPPPAIPVPALPTVHSAPTQPDPVPEPTDISMGRSSPVATSEMDVDPVDGDVATGGPVDAGMDTTNGDDPGRTKRVRKKRQLSASEIDPTSLRPDGSLPKRSRARVYRPSGALPVGVANEDLPLTKADEAYFARVEANRSKPELGKMRGYCPLWASTRRALQAAAEYLRDPVPTEGGSVEIGAGGIARGVILEGETPGQGWFWGTGKDTGTIITSIGPSRPRVFASDKANTPFESGVSDAPRPDTLADEILRATPSPIGQLVPTTSRSASKAASVSAPAETPAVEALLMAQRARTPVAVAVANDYAPVPFKVPQPFVVLGWFWIVDAWTEPILDIKLFEVEQERPMHAPTKVVWKFRFEWCEGIQSTCWWSSEDEVQRQPTPYFPQIDARPSWPVSGPGISGSTTVKSAETSEDPEWMYSCTQCSRRSARVYAQGDICLNESCIWLFGDAKSSPDHVGPTSSKPGPLRVWPRLLPEQLGLRLRPAAPESIYVARRQDAHVNRWQGWVCKKCGCANEARSWGVEKCEACEETNPRGEDQVFTHEALRDPSRPVCTGTRQDDGFAQWPFPMKRSAAVYADDIKIVRHGLDEPFGSGSAVFHVLSHENVNAVANDALVKLQRAGSGRRSRMPPFSRRAPERALSPFFTAQLGPEGAPEIAHFAVKSTAPWQIASSVHLAVADLINERMGRVFPGEAELNSLLIAAMPPHLPTSAHPLIPVGPDTIVAFLFLGSDGMIKFRRSATAATGRVRWGELSVQHGDVISLKTGAHGVDVEVKSDGFGYVCIARQVYAEDDDAKALGSQVKASFEAGQPIAHSRANGAPQRPSKPPLAPLTNWYIGVWPLDKTQPIRCLPSERDGAVEGDVATASAAVPPGPNSSLPTQLTAKANGDATDAANGEPSVTSLHTHTGRQVLTLPPPPPSDLAPPTTPALAKRAAPIAPDVGPSSPSSSVSGSKSKPRRSVGGKEKDPAKGKELEKGIRSKTVKVKEDKEMKGPGRGKGPRASTGGIGVKTGASKSRGRRSVGGNEDTKAEVEDESDAMDGEVHVDGMEGEEAQA